jgi:phosphohistidine phosphatase
MPDRAETLTLHLLRHAHAGDPLEWAGDDALRPLSRRGRRQAERLGAFLVAHAVRPGAIVSSPLVRARETAAIVGDALGVQVALDDRLAAGFDLAELEEIARATGSAAPMLVGHDPDLSEALCALCAAVGLTLRKGALATLECGRPLRPGGATLRWLVPPDLLEEP